MNDTSIKLNVEPLSNGNWYKWKVQMRMYMVAKELWIVMQDGDDVKVKDVFDKATDQTNPTKHQLTLRDATAMSIMVQVVDDTTFNTICNEDSACKMWKKLKSRFEDSSAANQRLVYNEWRSLTFNNSGSIRDYISKFDAVAARYMAVSGHLDDNSKVLQLLHSIQSDNYDHVLKSPGTMQMKYDQLCTQLIMYEDTWLKPNSSSGNGKQSVEAALTLAQRRNNNYTWRGNAQSQQQQYRERRQQGQVQRRVLVCYRCDREGHRAVECPDRVRALENKANVSGRREFLRGESTSAAYAHHDNENESVLATDTHNEISGWLVDSGASHHITNNKTLLLNYKSIKKQSINGFTEDSMGYAVGEGDVKLQVKVDGAVKSITVTSVWYVPGAQKNLLSVSALMSKGCRLVFENTKVVVTRNSVKVFTAALKGKLYAVDTVEWCPAMAMAAQSVANSDATALWHRRMGHASHQLIRSMMSSDAVAGMEAVGTSETAVCEGCAMGKHTREPFRRLPADRSTATLQLVHSDVGEANLPSWSSKMYYVTFIDDYSRRVWLYVMHKKSDVCDVFIKWKTLVENQTQQTIKVIRSDRGGEYVNDKLSTVFAQSGIQHQTTMAESPQSNGVAERMNRTLWDQVRCMLYSASLPEQWWAEAIMTAVYIHNRLVHTTTNGKTPMELWNGVKPDVSHMRVFGCICYAHVPHSKRSKTDAQSLKCLFIGYSHNSKGYRLYDMQRQRVIESRDVIFNENETLHSSVAPRQTARVEIDSGDYNSSTNGVRSVSAPIVPASSSVPAVPSSVAIGHGHSSGSVGAGGANAQNSGVCTDNDVQQEDRVVKIMAEDIDIASGVPIYQTEFEDGYIDWLPRSAFIDTDSDGEEVINEAFQQWESTHPQPNAQPQYNIKKVKLKPASTSTSSSKQQNTRGSKNVSKINRAMTAAEFVGVACEPGIPHTYNEAMESSDSPMWQQAMDAEMQSLQRNNTWTLVAQEPGVNVVGTKWVYTIKRNADGSVNKYKARLVAKGYSQVSGIDYNEVFAPVVKMISIRVILSIAAIEDMEIHQMDVKTAFLNSDLREEVYVRQPDGYISPGNESMVCRLNKTLYGLKQSPRVWWQSVDAFFESMGFKRIQCDYGVYLKWSNDIKFIISVYVDDLMLVCNVLSEIIEMKAKLNNKWEMSDLGELHHILGIGVRRDRAKRLIYLEQSRYISDVLERFNMSDCKLVATPCDSSVILSKSMSPVTPEEQETMRGVPYSNAVGSLMYAMTATRPDIAFAVSGLSAFMANPGEQHWTALKRVLRYLQGTRHYSLVLGGRQVELRGWCDADWASDKDTRRSVTGYIFKVGDGVISWQSKRQPTVATSSTEAEYMSVSYAAREAAFLHQLLAELGYNQDSITLHCDNQSCIALCNNPAYHQRSKHIDVQHHFIREKVETGEITLQYVPTEEMVADALTKSLAKVKHEWCADALGLRTCSQSGSVE